MLTYRIRLAIAGGLLLGAGIGLTAGHYDRPIMEVTYLQPPALRAVMKVATLYGSWVVLLPAGVLGMMFACHHQRRALALRLGIGMISAAVCAEVLKPVLARARPDFLHQVPSSGASFPSAHALDSVVVWGMLALLIAVLTERGKQWAKLLYAIPPIVGWSRVYLGVHWPGDVLGGWGIGLLILAAVAPPRAATGPGAPSEKPNAAQASTE